MDKVILILNYLEMVVPFVYTEEEMQELKNENKKLKEERDFFKEQAILWRKDWKVAYEEKRKLKSDLGTVIDERDNAFKKIKQLEERLDNKEKVNKQLREELKELNKMMLFETELEK